MNQNFSISRKIRFRFLNFLLFLFFISQTLAATVLDTETDATQDSGWSTVNCTYQEIYSDLNQLQCKMQKMDENSTASKWPAINMTGFWTPCQDSWCEVSYSFKSSTASSQTVTITGYVEGDASIWVLFGQENDESDNMLHLGNLTNTKKLWKDKRFSLRNVTEDSVLKVRITQAGSPESFAILDRITIVNPELDFMSIPDLNRNNMESERRASHFSNYIQKARNPIKEAMSMNRSDKGSELVLKPALISNKVETKKAALGSTTTPIPVSPVTLPMIMTTRKITNVPQIVKLEAKTSTSTTVKPVTIQEYISSLSKATNVSEIPGTRNSISVVHSTEEILAINPTSSLPGKPVSNQLDEELVVDLVTTAIKASVSTDFNLVSPSSPEPSVVKKPVRHSSLTKEIVNKTNPDSDVHVDQNSNLASTDTLFPDTINTTSAVLNLSGMKIHKNTSVKLQEDSEKDLVISDEPVTEQEATPESGSDSTDTSDGETKSDADTPGGAEPSSAESGSNSTHKSDGVTKSEADTLEGAEPSSPESGSDSKDKRDGVTKSDADTSEGAEPSASGNSGTGGDDSLAPNRGSDGNSGATETNTPESDANTKATGENTMPPDDSAATESSPVSGETSRGNSEVTETNSGVSDTGAENTRVTEVSSAISSINSGVTGGNMLVSEGERDLTEGSSAPEQDANNAATHAGTGEVSSEATAGEYAVTQSSSSGVADDSTDALAENSDVPVDNSGAPEEETDAPVESTDASGESEAPGEATDAPGENSDVPGESTDAQGESSDVVDDTTDAAGDVTDSPGESTDAPHETTDAPGESSDSAGESTDAPGENTDAPGEATDATAEATDAPAAEATDSPGQSTDAPGEVTDAPETTNIPEESTGEPKDDLPTTEATPETTTTGTTKRDNPVTEAYGSTRSMQGSSADLALYIGIPTAVLFVICVIGLVIYTKKKRSMAVTP